VHDIALNRTDVCIGPFWVTAERLKMCSFTQPLYVDNFRLLVRHDTAAAPSFAQIIYSPFKPLSSDVWLCLALTLFYVGLVRGAVERADGDEDDPLTSTSSTTLRAMTDVAQQLGIAAQSGSTTPLGKTARRANIVDLCRKRCHASEFDARSRARKMARVLTRLLKGQAFVWQGATGDWRGEDPRTVSQWVLLIGSSWSMLVIITFYTAQVAATVIFPSRSIAQVASFHQVMTFRRNVFTHMKTHEDRTPESSAHTARLCARASGTQHGFAYLRAQRHAAIYRGALQGDASQWLVCARKRLS
jgi:hypothetical protein